MSAPKKPAEGAVPTSGELLHHLFKTSHLLHRQFETMLAELDVPSHITGPRLRFLAAVNNAGKIRMNEMAAKLGIQARTVTQFVDALEQEKLLVRLPDPNDRRATLLQVTDIAPPLIEKASAAMRQVADKLMAPLTAEMRVQFIEALHILADTDSMYATDNKEG
ncbi:MarR family winged helix-turn-helix transcriptional regulator [Paenibacillus hamazuiensis]|uniref:MarR family winged helix-turn-helix transcriptional regulator n=1 Tax=Paenibacillus hamazuiensis TaxID=2936508 RepID=UPI00200D2C21|nr:MarR family transcriptional regulator [Paenibacillus hamazuiensis]